MSENNDIVNKKWYTVKRRLFTRIVFMEQYTIPEVQREQKNDPKKKEGYRAAQEAERDGNWGLAATFYRLAEDEKKEYPMLVRALNTTIKEQNTLDTIHYYEQLIKKAPENLQPLYRQRLRKFRNDINE